MKFLIVDDNVAMRRMIRLLVEIPDDLVMECKDGVEAWDACRADLADWIFMDIRMPRMDGIAACREILRKHPTARIIIVSEHGQPEMREAARKAGAKTFVLKDDLVVIQQIIGRPRTFQAPQTGMSSEKSNHDLI